MFVWIGNIKCALILIPSIQITSLLSEVCIYTSTNNFRCKFILMFLKFYELLSSSGSIIGHNNMKAVMSSQGRFFIFKNDSAYCLKGVQF